jgi:hypothetical protein
MLLRERWSYLALCLFGCRQHRLPCEPGCKKNNECRLWELIADEEQKQAPVSDTTPKKEKL